MAKVVVVAKIYPENVNENLEGLVDKIKEKLPSEIKVNDYKIEPLAFGIKVLRIQFLMPEEYEGGTTKLEEILGNIKGISEIEIEMVTRL